MTDVVNNASKAGHGGATSASPVRMFLSYRRDDVPDAADRLAESLARRFGKSQVFLDIDKIDIGAPFAKIVGEWVASCDVLLAVIGRGWIDATNDDGCRRLADPNDYVRLEIEAALSRDIRVVSVLIHGATIPKDTQLPASLVPLLERNAIELNRKYWDIDVEGLADAIERIASERSGSAAAKLDSIPAQSDPVTDESRLVRDEPRSSRREPQGEPRLARASAPATAAVTETVQVLITDLVGSTAVADRIGPRPRRSCAGALRVAAGALEHTGGREVKNLGDGLMAVFDSAAQSLVCAVEMQQAIEARNRRAEEQLGVRIGVSIGEAVEEGDYFGEPAVEATRLCAAADGGQIVVNALVRQVAGAREGRTLPPPRRPRAEGHHEPVEAFELRWEPLLSAGSRCPSDCASCRRRVCRAAAERSGSQNCGQGRVEDRCAWR